MRTVHVILGASMSGQHNSLEVQAQNEGIKLSTLKDGEAVVFINRKKDKMKAYSHNKVVSYVRFDDSRRGIDLSALDEIPRAFTSHGTLDYPKALRITLEKKLKSRKFDTVEVL